MKLIHHLDPYVIRKLNKIRGPSVKSVQSKQKSEPVAKRAEQLANELDAIDNAWQCDCGSIEYHDSVLTRDGTDEVVEHSRTCSCCGRYYAMPIDADLPTRLEGSD